MVRIFNNSFFLFICLTLVSLIFFSCDYGKIKSVTTIGETTIGIDESVAPVLAKETEEFMRLNKESKINSVVKTSTVLMADLLNGDIKTVVVKRDFNDSEMVFIKNHKLEVKRNKLALDAIGVIVNPANPVRRATFKQLDSIFTGKITDWKDFHDEEQETYKGKIKVFIARKNSSLHDFFRERVLEKKEFAKTDIICSTSTQMLDEVKKDKFAIGFIAMSWITKSADTLDSVVKPLKISGKDSSGRTTDYIGLHQAYVATKAYPLIMDVYIYSTDFNLNVSVGFISFLTSYDGQKIVLNSGLVPETQPVRIIQLN